MKHGRSDYYGRITDNAGKIPADEPVFLLRGCDPAAAQAVRAWASTHDGNGGNISMGDQARHWADQMDDYRDNKMGHPAKNADRPGDSDPLDGDEPPLDTESVETSPAT